MEQIWQCFKCQETTSAINVNLTNKQGVLGEYAKVCEKCFEELDFNPRIGDPVQLRGFTKAKFVKQTTLEDLLDNEIELFDDWDKGFYERVLQTGIVTEQDKQIIGKKLQVINIAFEQIKK